MKLKHVQFINTVSFGGQLQSASDRPVGDRPGQGGFDLELGKFDGVTGVKMTKDINGKPSVRLVPLSNVACYEPVGPVTNSK